LFTISNQQTNEALCQKLPTRTNGPVKDSGLGNQKLSSNQGKQHKHVYHGPLPAQSYQLHMTGFDQKICHAYKHPEDCSIAPNTN